MRYKKITPKNTKWTKTCQALKELFETLRCSKCKSSLHDAQQFLQCGHFSCFSCIKNSNKCIECHFSVNDDILKDDTIKKIVQACCTIAEQVGFKEIPNNVGTKSKESPVKEQTNSSNFDHDNVNDDSGQSKARPGSVSKKRKGVKKLDEIVAKKAKVEKIIPTVRIPKKVDKKNHHGETKLQEECKKGHKDNVKIFLDAGADPNTCCNAGWTPLQECADYGYLDIAELLLKKGADINKKGFQGRTPLHEAVQANQLGMVKFLLKHKAQKNIEDDELNEPIEYCKSEEIRMLLTCDVNNESPRTSRKNRNNGQNKKFDNSPGVSYNAPKNNHSVSAIDAVKVERDCDNSDSESEDDDDEQLHQERCSQNVTTSHQVGSRQSSPDIDSEEIDILN